MSDAGHEHDYEEVRRERMPARLSDTGTVWIVEDKVQERCSGCTGESMSWRERVEYMGCEPNYGYKGRSRTL